MAEKKETARALLTVKKMQGTVPKKKETSLSGCRLSKQDACNKILPTCVWRAKTWSPQVEDAYRFQMSGYRDELEYKMVQNGLPVDRWPISGFVKKLVRRDGCFYYFDKTRECPDSEVGNTKLYKYSV